MIIGIIPNTTKDKIIEVVSVFIRKLELNNIKYFISEDLLKSNNSISKKIDSSLFLKKENLFEQSDIVVAIGGDGTMLTVAYDAINYFTPLAGLNFGKLGFLAEFGTENIDEFIDELKSNNYTIEDRMVLEGTSDNKNLYAFNDIIIDKGGWPKIIELSITIDGKYVSTFSADGVIIATPTGSTGYSLSTGGPIVTPTANVITINPISPHTLAMRPLIIANNRKIEVTVNSPHPTVQINCDGQRVNQFPQPLKITIKKSEKILKLVHPNSKNYFETLRNKLFWGMDVRKAPKEF